MSSADPFRTDFRTGLSQFAGALTFLTRLPVGVILPGITPERDLAAASWTFPLVGALVGLAGGVVYVACAGAGLAPLLAATLSVAITAWLTGAMHENGLAATAEGFAASGSREAKLDRMEDPNLGTNGVLALLFGLVIRVAAIDALSWRGKYATLLLLIAAEAASRAAIVRVWHDLGPARPDALSRSGSGRPNERTMYVALGLAAGIVIVTAMPAAGFVAALFAAAGAAAFAVAFTRLSDERVGGETAHTLGAAQQTALIAFLVFAAAFV